MVEEKEDIINSFKSHGEYPCYYHESDIGFMMDRYAMRASIEFLKWYREYSAIHIREILDSGKLKSEEEMYDLWEQSKQKKA